MSLSDLRENWKRYLAQRPARTAWEPPQFPRDELQAVWDRRHPGQTPTPSALVRLAEQLDRDMQITALFDPELTDSGIGAVARGHEVAMITAEWLETLQQRGLLRRAGDIAQVIDCLRMFGLCGQRLVDACGCLQD